MEIFMKKFMISIALICAMFLFVSCGGSSESGDKGDGNETDDSGEVSDSETEDSEVTDGDAENPDEPKELAYPEVTSTSNKDGDIAQNVTIYDDVDVEHHLAEWYQPNNPSSKLLWLIFTTYDCSPCRQLKQDLLEINKAEYRERGFKIILVLNGLLSGPQPELEPEKVANFKDLFISEFPDTAQFEIYGYLKKEEQKVLAKFFSSSLGGAYPTWAFIDASTMEIVEYGEGWGDDMVGPVQREIELLLDEL